MNKGFTLVELLAVIIILGVLTLVTVVSVNPILKDAREGLSDAQINNIKESASLYYIKYGVGLDDFELENPKDCINVSELIESGYIENDEVTNPKTGEKILGSVKVTYNSNNYIYEYQDNACTNYDKGIICERVESTELGQVPEGNFIAGDAYNCEVDPDKEPYKFYILTTPDTNSETVNLIMDQNIYSDGTPAGMTGVGIDVDLIKYSLVAWNSTVLNTGGPVNAMQFLYNATKTWVNIDPVNYTYNDKTTPGATDRGYTSFVSTKGVAIITSLSGTATTIGSETEPLRARMPIYSGIWNGDYSLKIEEEGEVADKKSDNSNSYIYDNLSINGEKAPIGYWTLSSCLVSSDCAWHVNYGGIVHYGSVDSIAMAGARPVISVYKFQME